ncbi:MAG: hypothetical protein QOJ03_2842 [Frankiaceae bacterium]|nr:hypothetical protein [Frankiaceae bacterium]
MLVTSAPQSPREEQRDRQRRYLITMAIRVVCLVLAIVLARGWLRVVTITLALVLPWVAVVAANAGPKRGGSAAPSLFSRKPRREIAAGGEEDEPLSS